MDQERREWRFAQHEGMGHGAEELIADEALHHRKPRAERLDQAHRDVVAIDGKAPVGPADRGALEARRHRRRGAQQSVGKLILQIQEGLHIGSLWR